MSLNNLTSLKNVLNWLK